MDKKLNHLLHSLDYEIELKCYQIRQKKAEMLLKYLFVAFCVLFLVVPLFLVFLGCPLWISIIPVLSLGAFISILLAPLLLGRIVR